MFADELKFSSTHLKVSVLFVVQISVDFYAFINSTVPCILYIMFL